MGKKYLSKSLSTAPSEIFKRKVEKILFSLKHNNRIAEQNKISVYADDKHIAYLHPVSKEFLKNDSVISLIAKWRSKNQKAFPTRFIVTKKGTQNWMKNHLLVIPDRILFLLETLDGIAFAHLGLFRFDYQNKSCEIDNVLRGESVLPGSIKPALHTLISWAHDRLGIEDFYLQVFGDNKKAIAFYRKCGFRSVRRKLLKKIVESDMIRFTEISSSDDTSDAFIEIMKLQK